jgi:hypothetical protein
MNHSLYKHIICHCLLLLGAVLTSGSAYAEDPAPNDLPDWQVLEFEQKAFWATAKSRVEIAEEPGNDQRWELTATSSVVGNSEDVALSLSAENGQAVKRTRLSRGKDQRFKTFDYQPDYVMRERRNPGNDPATPPEQWAMSSSKKIPYPESVKGMVITDAYALLMLAQQLQAEPDASAEVVVHTDFNFYQVQMTAGKGLTIAVDYQIIGGEAVTGTRDTRAVKLQISPVEPLIEKPDFSLLGLHGYIILLFDQETGQLLQLRGTAPRIGPTEINLKSMTPRAAG